MYCVLQRLAQSNQVLLCFRQIMLNVWMLEPWIPGIMGVHDVFKAYFCCIYMYTVHFKENCHFWIFWFWYFALLWYSCFAGSRILLCVLLHSYIGDCRLPAACELFVREHGAHIVQQKLGRNLLLHLVNLVDFGLIRPEIVYRTAVQFLHLRRQLEDSADSVLR